MNRLSTCGLLAGFILLNGFAIAQEASSGFELPVAMGGIGRYSGSKNDGYSLSGGFRALLSPGVQLGSHWFAYSVVGAQSQNYFLYPLGYETGPVKAVFLQGYAGYRTTVKTAAVLIKAGRLMPAFGHYALEYNDAKSPLIEPPSMYGVATVLRPDQIPCNLRDILRQSYDDPIEFGCGGSAVERYGILPVTLYGIPGAQAEVSWERLDGRVQVTNSSPANPQSLLSRSQFAQWTVGAGYSLPGGIHLGVSGFRGPYLSRAVRPFLPSDKTIRDFRASGVGIDAQWFGGPWSAEGEWQLFRFDMPGFITSPTINGGYVQVKRILSPRLYIAGRSNWRRPGGATDLQGAEANQIDAHQETEEIVLGYRINRWQLLKSGFTYTARRPWSVGAFTWGGEQSHGFELQLVTSFTAISQGFR